MNYTHKIERVLQLAVDSVVDQIAAGRTICENEATLQLQLSRSVMLAAELHLTTPGETCFIELEKPWSGQKRGRIDLWFGFRSPSTGETRCAVEMKFFKKSNQREPNNRYDVFKDIARLEECRSKCEFSYILVVTDHPHYHSKDSYSDDTKDFDFRDGSTYKSGTECTYRTEKPHGPAITLGGSYRFNWSDARGPYRYLLTQIASIPS